MAGTESLLFRRPDSPRDSPVSLSSDILDGSDASAGSSELACHVFRSLRARSSKSNTGGCPQFCRLPRSPRATCVHMSSMGAHVCVYVPTFPSLQFRGFSGSVPLKAIFFFFFCKLWNLLQSEALS